MANYTVNFEILSNEIRIIEATRNRDQITVQSCTRAPVGEGTKGKLQDIIRRSITSKSSGEKCVATSVWAPSVIVRRIQMPVMTPQELTSAIRYEFENHIPFPINECFLDHYVVRKLGANERMEVMLAASKRNLVEERRKMLADAGWDLNYIDLHPFALANAYSLYQPKQAKAYAMIYLGETDEQLLKAPNFLIVMKEGQPVIVRDLGENIPMQNGQLSNEDTEQIVEAVQKSCEFYENSADEIIENIYVTKSGTRLDGLEKSLGELLETKMQHWSLMDKLHFANNKCKKEYQENEALYLIAMGLAIRSLKT